MALKVTIGIQSIGDMGLGVAKLLGAHGYRVVSNTSGRSADTQKRARSAAVELLSSDREVLVQSDYIFSIVPPRDSLETGRRFAGAWSKSKDERATAKQQAGHPACPLYYVDFNAIAPGSANEVKTLFEGSAPEIRFVDGGIIGGPPTASASSSSNGETANQWYKPSLVCSGPDRLADAELGGKQLADVLNVRHVAPTIGAASGLKMCFASVNKGFTAIAIQSFTTAQTLGVLPQLRSHLQEYTPGIGKAAEGITKMPPKAYRWVGEMQEIADTFHDVSGFGKEIFEGAREVFALVADDTELGKEKTEERIRGKTPEDVALLVAEGLNRKKQKMD